MDWGGHGPHSRRPRLRASRNASLARDAAGSASVSADRARLRSASASRNASAAWRRTSAARSYAAEAFTSQARNRIRIVLQEAAHTTGFGVVASGVPPPAVPPARAADGRPRRRNGPRRSARSPPSPPRRALPVPYRHDERVARAEAIGAGRRDAEHHQQPSAID